MTSQNHNHHPCRQKEEAEEEEEGDESACDDDEKDSLAVPVVVATAFSATAVPLAFIHRKKRMGWTACLAQKR